MTEALTPFAWKNRTEGTTPLDRQNLNSAEAAIGTWAVASFLGKSEGTGELLGARVTTPPAAHLLDVRDGTLASPVKIGVSASVSRTDSTTRAEVNAMGPTGTDGPDGATAARFAIKGAAGSQVQVSAIVGMAWQTGESSGGEGSADACSLYGFARTTNNAVGRAIPMYLESSRETATSGGQQAVELRVKNESGTADSYVANAPSTSMGVWLNASGGKNSACGFQIGKGFSRLFDVGFAVNEGAVKSAAFRDDSNSENSLLIKGEHSAGAIKVEAPSGTSEELIVLKGPAASNLGSRMANAAGGQKTFVAGGTGAFLTGTVNGDVGVQIAAVGKTWHVGTATGESLLRVNNTGIGFFGHAPVAKPAKPAANATAIIEALEELGLVA